MDTNSGERLNASESEVRPWSDLPEELLQLILHPLTLADRFKFSLVCKRWSIAARMVPRYNGLSYGFPCLLSINDGGKICTLLDPFGNEMHIKSPDLSSPPNILFSNSGWLLLLDDDESSIFFYNPLTKSMIMIPDVYFSHLGLFSFSSPPTSPDCLVIAMVPSYRSYISVYLWRRGEDDWTGTNFPQNSFSFARSHVSPVFYQKRFYCLGEDGSLAVYDPTDNLLHFNMNPKPRQDISRASHMHLTVSNGELVMIIAEKFGDSVGILKLNTLTNQWEDLRNLGERSCFVGRTTSISSEAVPGSRIYFPRVKDNGFMSYSCEEEKFYPSGNFYGSRVFPMSAWIEPVWFLISVEDLDWCE